MDLVVLEGDVVLVDGVPLLDADLLGPRAALRGDQLLQVADRVYCFMEGRVTLAGSPSELDQVAIRSAYFGT